MKRIFILVVVTLLVVGSIFAEESTLIDFSKLTADITVDGQGDDPPPNQNKQTLMDFSNEATSNFTARQKLAMKSSLAIGNWDVVFASSSQNVTTKQLSFTKEATSTAFEKVMGVRIHFPTAPFNSWAKVKPPFEIPAFEESTVGDDGTLSDPDEKPAVTRFEGEAGDDGKASGGYGLVKNVGAIKSIAVNVYGLNFPHSLSVILIDDKGAEKTYFMGYLNFEGWGELRWENPAYVQNVRNREVRIDPTYPNSQPYVKFGGFLIQRAANAKGGDFITYFKDVKIIYDQAVLKTSDSQPDIDDEATWSIIQAQDTARQKTNMQQLGQIQMQRQLDSQRQAQETTFKETPGADKQEE